MDKSFYERQPTVGFRWSAQDTSQMNLPPTQVMDLDMDADPPIDSVPIPPAALPEQQQNQHRRRYVVFPSGLPENGDQEQNNDADDQEQSQDSNVVEISDDDDANRDETLDQEDSNMADMNEQEEAEEIGDSNVEEHEQPMNSVDNHSASNFGDYLSPNAQKNEFNRQLQRCAVPDEQLEQDLREEQYFENLENVNEQEQDDSALDINSNSSLIPLEELAPYFPDDQRFRHYFAVKRQQLRQDHEANESGFQSGTEGSLASNDREHASQQDENDSDIDMRSQVEVGPFLSRKRRFSHFYAAQQQQNLLNEENQAGFQSETESVASSDQEHTIKQIKQDEDDSDFDISGSLLPKEEVEQFFSDAERFGYSYAAQQQGYQSEPEIEDNLSSNNQEQASKEDEDDSDFDISGSLLPKEEVEQFFSNADRFGYSYAAQQVNYVGNQPAEQSEREFEDNNAGNDQEHEIKQEENDSDIDSSLLPQDDEDRFSYSRPSSNHSDGEHSEANKQDENDSDIDISSCILPKEEVEQFFKNADRFGYSYAAQQVNYVGDQPENRSEREFEENNARNDEEHEIKSEENDSDVDTTSSLLPKEEVEQFFSNAEGFGYSYTAQQVISIENKVTIETKTEFEDNLADDNQEDEIKPEETELDIAVRSIIDEPEQQTSTEDEDASSNNANDDAVMSENGNSILTQETIQVTSNDFYNSVQVTKYSQTQTYNANTAQIKEEYSQLQYYAVKSSAGNNMDGEQEEGQDLAQQEQDQEMIVGVQHFRSVQTVNLHAQTEEHSAQMIEDSQQNGEENAGNISDKDDDDDI